MPGTEPSARINRCPQCGKSCRTDKENSYRPFCSERCKMIDLGDWLDERHRISEPANHWTGSETDDSSVD